MEGTFHLILVKNLYLVWGSCRVRLAAQQASKLLNVVCPDSGSAVSAGIAALGISAIGKAAIAYYIDGRDMEEAKKLFETAKKERK